MMVRRSRTDLQMLSFRSKKEKKRTIIVGLKSDNYSREILLRLLTLVVKPEDNVVAIHVQSSQDIFDPNTFHIHEDLCKSKKVEFQVKVCIGDSYVSVLTHQVRVCYATMLALGSSLSGPNELAVTSCLKALPPTCTLLVINNVGRILLKKQGTSQQGSSSRRPVLQSSLSSPTYNSANQTMINHRLQKSLTVPASSTPASRQRILYNVRKPMQVPRSTTQKLSQRLTFSEEKRSSWRFTLQELRWATNNFSPKRMVGVGGNSEVYCAEFEGGQAAAVKILKTTQECGDDLFREVDILSSIKHENIVQIIGYCEDMDMQAIVYNLLKGNLKQSLRHLRWSERMRVAVGVAKALEYLHHSCNPPIIHRDVKSSNILLTDNCQPQLSDFGAAMEIKQTHQSSTVTKPLTVVGTFGYLAPEYMMYGKVDEKIDVYSYGVVLLELITGKEAIQRDQMVHESLVLWARSLLSYGLCKRLIDPCLNEDYSKEEMEIMMIAARLCLMHSSSRRPTMKMILRLFQEPECWLKMQRERDELLNRTSPKGEKHPWRRNESISSDTLVIDDT